MTNPVVESTRDVPPPARVGIWAVPFTADRRKAHEHALVHYCEHGQPKAIPT